MPGLWSGAAGAVASLCHPLNEVVGQLSACPLCLRCQAVYHRRWARRSWSGRPRTSGWRCRVPATRWRHARPRPHLCPRRARPRPRSPLTPPFEAQLLLIKQGCKTCGHDVTYSHVASRIPESAAPANDVNTIVATPRLVDSASAKEDTTLLDNADAVCPHARLNRLGTQSPQPLQSQWSYYCERVTSWARPRMESLLMHPLRPAWAAMGHMGWLAAVIHLRRELHTAETRRERRALLLAGCA